MLPTTAAALAPALAHREGVLLRSELPLLGLDDRLADREVRRGRWVRPAPQVIVAAARPSERQLALAGLLHARPLGLLTGRAACRLYELRDVPAGGPVEVLVPHRTRRTSTTSVRVVRSALPAQRLLVRGLPSVPPARAVVDASRDAPLHHVRGLLLAAVADDLVDLADVDALVADGPARGSAALRRAALDAHRGLASAPEAELADLLVPWCARRGLRLLFNPWVLVGGGLLGRPDAYLPDLGVGVESDSLRHHGTGQDLSATFRRHARFADLGLRLGHETPWDVRQDPAAVLARVRADVDERTRSPWQPPPGLVVLPHDDPAAPRRRAVRWWERAAG